MADVIITGQVSGFDKIQSALGQTSSELNNLKGSGEKTGASMASLAVQFAAVTAAAYAVYSVFTDVVEAAAQQELSQKRLEAALRNVGTSYKVVGGSLEEYIGKMELATGFSDDQLRGAMSRLVQITGDYDKSLRLLSLTTDIAAAANMDMESAARVVGMALQGNTRGLAQLGIRMKEGASSTQILNELMHRFGGTAQTMGDTAQGAFKRFGIAIENLEKAFGVLLLPIVTKVVTVIANLIQKLADSPKFIKGTIQVFKILGEAVLIVSGILAGPFLIPIGIAIAMIGTLAGTIITIIRHFKDWYEAVKSLLEPLKAVGSFIKDVFTVGVKQAVQNFAENWTHATDTVKDKMGVVKDDVSSDLDALKNKFNDTKKSVTDFFSGLTEAPKMDALALPDVSSQPVELDMNAMLGYYDVLDEIGTAQEEKFSDWDASWQNFFQGIEVHAVDFATAAQDAFMSLSTGIGDSVGQAIMFGEDLGKSMMNVLKNVAASIISFLVQMGIRWILTHVIMKAIGSAFHLSQIMGNMGVTYSNAYASTAAIPIVGPVIAPEVAAASVQAMLAGSLAFGGAAAGGLDEVPNTGTFLIHRGERIVSPQQNRDLTAFLAGRGQGGSATTVVQAPLILQGMAIVDDYSLDQASEMLADRVQKRLSLRMR